jgi:hypothetical protein
MIESMNRDGFFGFLSSIMQIGHHPLSISGW